MAQPSSDLTKTVPQSLSAELLTLAEHIDPPGGYRTVVEHPSARLRNQCAVEIGVVIEHRFAFFYWLRCKQELLRRTGAADDGTFNPPDLISFDWHDDCGCESDFDPDQLSRLDQRDETEVAVFCWAGLRRLNDGHILPAMWLNAVGNAYIVQRQHQNCRRQNCTFHDRHGRPHQVHYFRRPSDLPATYQATNTGTGVIWDVDVDYFTRTREATGSKKPLLLRDEEIMSLLAPRSEWMPLILANLKAVTVALEPSYTGGLSQSLGLFSRWERSLFTGSISDDRCRWRAAHRQE